MTSPAHNYSYTADIIRRALRLLIQRGELNRGDYTKLANHYGISRERVRQLANDVKREYVGLSRAPRFGPSGRVTA